MIIPVFLSRIIILYFRRVMTSPALGESVDVLSLDNPNKKKLSDYYEFQHAYEYLYDEISFYER